MYDNHCLAIKNTNTSISTNARRSTLCLPLTPPPGVTELRRINDCLKDKLRGDPSEEERRNLEKCAEQVRAARPPSALEAVSSHLGWV